VKSAALLAAGLLAACTQREPHWPQPAGADAAAGRVAIERLQCGACHEIPGVTAARGRVGPSLENFGRRVYLAGKFPQDPQLVARWVADAPSLAPGTAMPAVPMTAGEARDIAAYLHGLR
jgi:cytochrome c